MYIFATRLRSACDPRIENTGIYKEDIVVSLIKLTTPKQYCSSLPFVHFNTLPQNFQSHRAYVKFYLGFIVNFKNIILSNYLFISYSNKFPLEGASSESVLAIAYLRDILQS